MDKVKKISEECHRIEQMAIEHKNNPVDKEDDIQTSTTIFEMEHMIKFINSLEEEPVIVDAPPYDYVKGFSDGRLYEKRQKEEPVSEDLEETSKKYSSCIYLEEVLSDDDQEVLKARLMNTFKAGANWQKEQDKETIELAEDHAMLAGMIKGKEEAITKACKYLQEHREEVETEDNGIAGWISDEFIEKFKKYMNG